MMPGELEYDRKARPGLLRDPIKGFRSLEDARAMEETAECEGACQDHKKMRDLRTPLLFPSNTTNSEHCAARDGIENPCHERTGISQSSPSCAVLRA